MTFIFGVLIGCAIMYFGGKAIESFKQFWDRIGK